jgi:HEAT repeat protein
MKDMMSEKLRRYEELIVRYKFEMQQSIAGDSLREAVDLAKGDAQIVCAWLDSDDAITRSFAALVLGQLGDLSVVDRLIDASQPYTERDLSDDATFSAHVDALVALGNLKAVQAASHIRSNLKHGIDTNDASLVFYSFRALESMGDTQLADIAQQLVTFDDFDVRKMAKRFIRQAGSK